MELCGDEGITTLMQLVSKATDCLKHGRFEECNFRPFWDKESKTVILSQPYKLFLKLNQATCYWHVMDSSCVTSLPCVLTTTLDTVDPKHVLATTLQVVVEVYQEKGVNWRQTFLPYVVLIDFEVSENHPPKVPRPLPRSINNNAQGLGCYLCKHEKSLVVPKSQDQPDGEVCKLMEYSEDNITHHIHYVQIQHKSVAQLKNKTIPQINIVASLLKRDMHKESVLQFVMVLRGNLYPLSALLAVGGIFRLHLPLHGSLPDWRGNASHDVRQLPWIELPSDTAFFRHTCPLWPHPVPVADVPGMIHQHGKIYNRKIINQNFETEKNNKVDTPGFGVPGDKTVMLEIRYGDADSTDSTCVYFNNWGNKTYPLGLMNGIEITLTNVFKKTSQKGSSYLQVNDLTGITLASMPTYHSVQSAWFPLTDISLLEKLRAGSPICGVVSNWKLLKVEFKLICSCSAVRVGHVCPEPNCRADYLDMTVEVRARIITYGLEGPVLIHFKDDNVRKLLGLTKDHWQTLSNLSIKTDLIYNCDKNYEPGDHSYAQNIFHAFCRHPRENTNLYLNCRKFAGDRPMCPDITAANKSPVAQIFAFEVSMGPPEGQLWN